MIGLTPKQTLCLDVIKRLTRDGMPPSFDEIQLALGLASKSNVHRLIHVLAERGAIEIAPNRARSMRVIEDPQNADILKRPTPQLRLLRDQIDREMRKRSWGPEQ
jgi:SOS-response transcriptional repressor LexA